MAHMVKIPKKGFQVRFGYVGKKYKSKLFVDEQEAIEFCAVQNKNSPAPKNQHVSGMVGLRVEFREWQTTAKHATLIVGYSPTVGVRRMNSISITKNGIEYALQRALTLRNEIEKFAEYLPILKALVEAGPKKE